MTDTVTVGNRAHTSLRITEPALDTASGGRSFVIYGARHASARTTGYGVTHDVDADVLHAWLADRHAEGSPLAEMVFVVSGENALVPIEEPASEQSADAAQPSEDETTTRRGRRRASADQSEATEEPAGQE